MELTVEELRQRGWIVLECLSGSRAYGLDTPTSDTDLKGVFILPEAEFYGLDYVPQVQNATNDEVYYELR
ncbi:Predicted nucleotidyltransferase [Catalinimonas alkaloidigena]|uniref:Predicted nucleotidyltransferase n=1 Tax=Catalinimonas alkaloidigena TaxID=1075417 RepID=A0A1G9AH28_9BACT|nr:nucleotidyltransferase domain-containing protein [Catalinimonas alkaloidigena]SDK25805.1 Predicted nucleotidyltransferase [Catalinimonas alkaloidigena]